MEIEEGRYRYGLWVERRLKTVGRRLQNNGGRDNGVQPGTFLGSRDRYKQHNTLTHVIKRFFEEKNKKRNWNTQHSNTNMLSVSFVTFYG